MTTSVIEFSKRVYTLEYPKFRRVLLVILPVLVIAIFIAAQFAEAVSDSLGYKLTNVALLLLLGVLVEHVANQITRSRDLEKKVDNLDKHAREIAASVGVGEGVEIFETDHEASHKQREFIVARTPRNVKLCEYSADRAKDHLLSLVGSENTQSVQLLVCHPDKAVNPYQVQRILGQMSALSRSLTVQNAENMGLEIRCYTHPASLRGRLFDKQLVVFGCYTYDRRDDETDDVQIWGAENPVVFAWQSHPYGQIMSDWFDGVFTKLWDKAVPLQQAFSNYQGEYRIKKAWLSQVSKDP